MDLLHSNPSLRKHFGIEMDALETDISSSKALKDHARQFMDYIGVIVDSIKHPAKQEDVCLVA